MIIDDWVRSQSVSRIDRVARKFDWRIYAWAFMSNHIHFVFQLRRARALGRMREHNTGSPNDSNFRFGRINHCFGQRFWSTHIKTEAAAREHPVHRPGIPARAGIGEHPGDSDWTSFRATAGIDMPGEALALPALMRHFGTKPTAAQAAFKRFIWDGRERCLAPWQDGIGILR